MTGQTRSGRLVSPCSMQCVIHVFENFSWEEAVAIMKFTGLVLICASSVLALLLPAIGVVKFPMVHRAAIENSQAASDMPPLPGSPSLSAAPSGLPVSTTGFSGSESLGSASQEVPLLGPPWTKQKLGLSAWVFLAPVMLLGLVLWTFAPNRRGVGR